MPWSWYLSLFRQQIQFLALHRWTDVRCTDARDPKTWKYPESCQPLYCLLPGCQQKEEASSCLVPQSVTSTEETFFSVTEASISGAAAVTSVVGNYDNLDSDLTMTNIKQIEFLIIFFLPRHKCS